MPYHPFKGKIKIDCKDKADVFNFNVQPEETTVNDVLMCQFENIKLSSEEKKDLRANYRKELFQFQHSNVTAISEYAEKIVKVLNKNPNKKIEVTAGGLGSYICLAAMFSGKLSKDIKVKFTLSSVPLTLFPKELLKQKKLGDHIEVQFLFKDNSWLKSFKTLYTCPKYMKFTHKFIMDTTFERVAA